MEDITTPDWHSTGAAARIVGVSERTLQRFIRSGRIKAVKLSPRRTKITGAELRRFLTNLPAA